LYSCQVVTDRLSRATVAEHALKLADTEGVDAVTIRRLAQDLGVTPMALYWHFKNKDELLLGIADHVLAGVTPTRDPGDPWLRQLRAMVESLVTAMREHPSLPALLQAVDKEQAASFARATNDALELLTRGGFNLDEGYWIASYLLHGSIGLVAAQPGCPTVMTPHQAAEWRRQKRLNLEKLPADEYPMVVAFARTLDREPDVDRYYRFGIDLLMAAVEAKATVSRRRGAGSRKS
jgi:TetR/AcrR family transcriptional regulator, tetracycline repressor protein